MIEKVFEKKYGNSRMRISFTSIGGPIIVKELEMDSPYKEEMEKDEQLFYLKKFNPEILEILIQKSLKKSNSNPSKKIGYVKLCWRMS